MDVVTVDTSSIGSYLLINLLYLCVYWGLRKAINYFRYGNNL